MPKTQINLEGWQDYRGNMALALELVPEKEAICTR